MKQAQSLPEYLYTFISHEDEKELCQLELRSLFNETSMESYVLSSKQVDMGRSPFMKQRVSISLKDDSLEGLVRQVKNLSPIGTDTFKIVFVETEHAFTYEEQRDMERTIGLHIKGKADMRNPDRMFGIAKVGNRWVFGDYVKSEAVWLKHVKKPQNYSTALSTRLARAAVNIAIPNPTGIRAIDPCCGIGTVLLEAISMGIDIVGSDVNPLAVRGARRNLSHYGYEDVVTISDIGHVQGCYDVLILDMPYNLCSVITAEEQLYLLSNAARLAGRALIITTEVIDPLINKAGFTIIDRCEARKGTFSRQVLVCSRSPLI